MKPATLGAVHTSRCGNGGVAFGPLLGLGEVQEDGLAGNSKGTLCTPSDRMVSDEVESRWCVLPMRNVASVRNSRSANLKNMLDERNIDGRPLKCRCTMVPRMSECKVDGGREKTERQLFIRARTTALNSWIMRRRRNILIHKHADCCVPKALPAVVSAKSKGRMFRDSEKARNISSARIQSNPSYHSRITALMDLGDRFLSV
jgi:hypothetical protein